MVISLITGEVRLGAKGIQRTLDLANRRAVLFSRRLVEQDVERMNAAIADDEQVRAGIFRRFVSQTGAPGNASRIVEHLRLAMRHVDVVEMGRTQVASKLVDRIRALDDPRRHVEDGILCPEFVDRRATALVVAFSEHLLQVAMEQLTDTRSRLVLLDHFISPRRGQRCRPEGSGGKGYKLGDGGLDCRACGHLREPANAFGSPSKVAPID
jgi:hypothetical protein